MRADKKGSLQPDPFFDSLLLLPVRCVVMKFDVDTCPVAGLESPANVLVTGASSGIGQAMLRQLLENRHVGRAFAVSRSATTRSTRGIRVAVGPRADRLFAPHRAATQLLQIIAESAPEDSGRFIAWDGQDIPW